MTADVTLAWRGALSDAEMVDLVESYGGRAVPGWWDRIRDHSLGWVTARAGDGSAVGFVNVAWDGGDHAFLVDTRTRRSHQRRGIATAVVELAAEHARAAGCEWLHVDFEDAELARFYFDACGFRPTRAGLIHLPSLPPRTQPPPMHPNVRTVVEAAAARGLAITVEEFPEGTSTAADAAAAVGARVAQIVKSLVFLVDGEPVLALVSGANRLDEGALAEVAGGRVRRADADSVRAATGFPIGGVPPFGHATSLRTFVDQDLLAQPTVWAAAGTPRHVFAANPDDLLRVSGGQPAELADRGRAPT